MGAYAYQRVDGWNLLDSFYFVVVTVTTIGYGDISPVTPTGKIFNIFYSFFGVGMAFYFLFLIGGAMFKKHIKRNVIEIKREFEKEEESKKSIKKTRKMQKKKR